MALTKPIVLLFTDWYEPGFKAGGPIRSCVNMVQTLKNEFRFFVVTSDRDLGDSVAYPDVQPDQWNIKGDNESVFYASPGTLTARKIMQMILQIQPTAIYLNSMFSPVFTLRPLWVLQKIKYTGKIVLAPRGMLKKSALAHKPYKKRLFLLVAGLFGFTRKIIFHAIDEQEKQEVETHFGRDSNVRLVANIPSLPVDNINRTKDVRKLKIVFISRVHPVKNLLFALDVMMDVADLNGIEFDIYGAIDDEPYYRKCLDRARELKSHMSVRFMGEVNNSEVQSVLQQYHLFFLPTKGENFGHAIFEALASGCPVLLSDQTPWNDVSGADAGWAFPLSHPEHFAATIRNLYKLNQEAFDQLSLAARKYAVDYFSKTDYKGLYIDLFGIKALNMTNAHPGS